MLAGEVRIPHSARGTQQAASEKSGAARGGPAKTRGNLKAVLYNGTAENLLI